MKLIEFAKTNLVQLLSDYDIPESYFDRVIDFLQNRFKDAPIALIGLINRDSFDLEVINIIDFCSKVEKDWSEPGSEVEILLPENTESLAEWQIETPITVIEIVSDYGEVYRVDIYITES
jgi:hypothetical protein